jgi:predicted Zn-dependent peptidase
LDIIVDMMKNTKFDKAKFEKEKKVILEEIKMYKDNPRTAVMEQIEKNMFEKPFGELIIGSKETVSGLDRDFVADYFKKTYNPSNYIVSLVGNADFDKVCNYLEKNFESNDGKVEIKEIRKKNSESVEERAGIDQANFVFCMHAPLKNEKDFPALEILDAYLADGMSSKIFLEIREKRGLAYAIRSLIEVEENYSLYLIYVGTMKESVEEVKNLIIEEFKGVENIKEKEFEDARKRVLGLKKVMSEESAEVMKELLFEELSGKAENYYEFEERIKMVKIEDVKKLAKKLLDQGYGSAAIVPK